jgi:hypothetical protein
MISANICLASSCTAAGAGLEGDAACAPDAASPRITAATRITRIVLPRFSGADLIDLTATA